MTGEPQLTVNIGSSTRTASYSASSGANVDFTYTVQVGDADTDGISVDANSVALNGGTIKDGDSHNAALSHAGLAAQSSHKVDAIVPTIWTVSVLLGPDNGKTFRAGETVLGLVHFSEDVTVTGSPQLTLTIGDSTRTADYYDYLSGQDKVYFTYTVQPGDLDSDGISFAVNSVALNGGTIQDSDGQDADLAHAAVADVSDRKVDGVAPTVSSVALTSTPASGVAYTAGEVVTARVTFSKNVTVTGQPQLTLSVGAGTRTATYSSATSSGANVDFTYTAQSGDNARISIAANSVSLNGGTIKDGVGNDATLTHAAAGDQLGLAVTLTSSPANGGDAYSAGEVITARVTFSETVTVTGAPQLTLNVGSNARTASYSSSTSSGANVDFTYTVQSGESDSDGISISANSLTLNGGTIQDGDDNDAALAHPAVAADSKHKVDGIVPTVSLLGRQSSPDNGDTYRIGEVILMGALFSEGLTVTGKPQLTLNIGDLTRTATYYGTHTSNIGDRLMFSYTVQAGDRDTDGISLSANSLALNGGTIEDDAGNDADLDHAAVAAESKQKVDGIAPTVSSVVFTSTPASDEGYAAGEVVTARVTFSENVTVTGAPQLTLNVGSNARTASYSSATSSGANVDFTYTAQSNDLDTDGIAIATNSLALNSGTIKDSVGNDATLTHTALGADSGQKVANAAPTVSSITLTSTPTNGGTYRAGEVVAARVTFSETVTVTGAPQLTLSIGDNSRTAAYSSATSSGANVDFNYTVQSTDSDGDGISIAANSLGLNSGTIQDNVSNNATLTHTAVAAHSEHKVDGAAPGVFGVSLASTPASGDTYVAGEVITVRVTFSEAVTVTGAPQLTLSIGNNTRTASYSSATSSGANVDFAYTAQTGDTDTDGISIAANSLGLNSGAIQDSDSNNAALFHAALAAQSKHQVEGRIPRISSVELTSTPANGDTYRAGETITATVTFSNNVVVTGTPQLQLNFGTLNSNTKVRNANHSGTSDSEVSFTYTVQAGDVAAAGISINPNSVSGTIRSNDGFAFWPVHASVAADAEHKVDTATRVNSLSITSSYPTGQTFYGEGAVITVRATFSEAITGDVANLTLPLQMENGTVSASYSAHSGQHVDFTYTVGSGDWDFDGLDIAADNLGLSSGSVTGSGSLAVNLKHPAYAFLTNGKVRADLLWKTVRIKHSNYQRCLDVSHGTAKNGQNLWAYDCNGTDAQKWILDRREQGTEKGRYRLFSKLADSSYCLDNTGTLGYDVNVHLWSCLPHSSSHAPHQSFDLEHISGNNYRIVFQQGGSKSYLVIVPASQGQVPDVRQAVFPSSKHEHWTIELHP